ncbi:MAG: alpha/beta hydrolase [Candidatus Xenobia bacterium]
MDAKSREILSRDGTKLRLLEWGDAPKSVILVHGQAEHVGRYGYVAQALVKAGYHVAAADLRGHGKSGGNRCHVERWTQYHEDVRAVVEAVARPYVLLGHSMGGLVVLDMMDDRVSHQTSGLNVMDLARQRLEPPPLGVIVSNPLLQLAFTPPAWKVAAGKLLSNVIPTLALPTELDTRLLSRDAEVVRLYNSDPLVGKVATSRWFTEMLAAQERVRSSGPSCTRPLLMLLGGADGICLAKASEQLYETWAGPKALKQYPNLYHELLNEPERDQVLGDMLAWLQELFAQAHITA